MKKQNKWIKKRLLTFKLNGQERYLVHLKRTYRELFRYCQLADNRPEQFIFPDDMDEVNSDNSFRNIHGIITPTKITENPDDPDNSIEITLPNERINKKSPDKIFEKFWLLNRELFIEPVDEIIPVKVIKEPITELSKEKLYLEIDLRDKESALFNMKLIIEKNIKKLKFVSKAPFQLSLDQQFIRLKTLMAYRLAYVMRQQHLKKYQRKDVPDRQEVYEFLIKKGLVNHIIIKNSRTMDNINGEIDVEQEGRKISFYCKRARDILKGIGTKKCKFP